MATLAASLDCTKLENIIVLLVAPAINMVTKNINESNRLQRKLKAKTGKCYKYAWEAIERLDAYRDATYVEGFTAFLGFINPHAWVEVGDVIIDPCCPDDPLEAPVVYVPGLRFEGRAGLEKAMEIPGWIESGMKLPIHIRYGPDGSGSPDFRAALELAVRYVWSGIPADCPYYVSKPVSPQLGPTPPRPAGCTVPWPRI